MGEFAQIKMAKECALLVGSLFGGARIFAKGGWGMGGKDGVILRAG